LEIRKNEHNEIKLRAKQLKLIYFNVVCCLINSSLIDLKCCNQTRHSKELLVTCKENNNKTTEDERRKQQTNTEGGKTKTEEKKRK